METPSRQLPCLPGNQGGCYQRNLPVENYCQPLSVRQHLHSLLPVIVPGTTLYHHRALPIDQQHEPAAQPDSGVTGEP
jgi:hypothetical protein